MEYVAYILGLATVISVFFVMGRMFKTSSEGGSKFGTQFKTLFTTLAFLMTFTVPVALLEIADELASETLETLATTLLYPMTFTFMLYIFLLVWMYIHDSVKTMSGDLENRESI